MNKEEYASRIDELYSKLNKPSDKDYSSKSKIAKSNKAARELHAIHTELRENIVFAEELLSVRLYHDDIHITQLAATYCLDFNLHAEEAVAILEYIVANGDYWSAVGAERRLKIWRGELDPMRPW
jgi:hypothetical protein